MTEKWASGTMRCKNCGNRIEVTGLEHRIISLADDIMTAKKMGGLNILIHADSHADCCSRPDYTWKDK